MRTNKLLIATLSLVAIAGTSCLKDGYEKNQYICEFNTPRYITMNANNINYIPDEATYATGGALQIKDSTNHKITALELYYSSDSKPYGFVIKMNEIVEAKSYEQDDISSAKIILNGIDHNLFNTRIQFTELRSVTESTDPNIFYYENSSGNFSGQYVLPNTTDTLHVEGTFCTDEFPG